MKKLGLVTVLYKSDDVLQGFIKSLSIQTYRNCLLYFVDNSVNDASTQLLYNILSQYPNVSFKYLPQQGNTGVAAGNNAGIKVALQDECDYVLLLNNDIEIEQDNLLEQMICKAEDSKESIIVPKILFYDTRKIWMAGGYMDHCRALGVHYGMNKSNEGIYNIETHISYAPTCFMLLSKQVFEKTGLMDEQYFAYYDDTDFVLRALKKGFTMLYMPSQVILHKVSSSAGINSAFYVYYSNRNKLYFIRKHYKGFKRAWLIAYSLVSRCVFWFNYDKQRKQKLIQGLKDGFALKVNS